MPLRRAGAPRLIDWTGERCVPWAPDVQVVYEHFHRYLWAKPLVAGRKVLDLGSGEGFGAALLAESASEVVGVDIDPTTVEHSRLGYAHDTLRFAEASATDLGDFADGSFDAVVAFEVIEHLREQEQMLAEVARVLAPGGLLIVSTPERRVYSEETGNNNPFHERELTREELGELLGGYESVALFGQRAATGSRITAATPGAGGGHLALRLERDGDGWREAPPPEPLYLIAVAANGPLPSLPGDSTLSDYELGLVRGLEGKLHNAEAEHRESVRALTEHAREEHQRIASALMTRTTHLAQERERSAGLQQELWRIEGSVTWRTFQRARNALYGRIGEDSAAATALGATLRWVGRAMSRDKGTDAPAVRSWDPISLPDLPSPEVSIVIPVYSGAEDTERCLISIVGAGDRVSYELVIVDDDADADTKALLGVVDGARVVENERNLGFLYSVNRGAAQARGRHIVLLNNDTEVRPGWLTSMVARAESEDDVGVVAAKLLYPDGTLQEAGGIVWKGGVPANYGRGQDAGASEYNYVREVDYGSAAALLVRAEVWKALGGFDERYSPGYFEDTDLCFGARELGWRVVYEPRAEVVHFEGRTMGTDLDSGLKRHQALNAPKFAHKWSEVLDRQPEGPALERERLASDRTGRPHVLVIDHQVPQPDRDSGSLRMWHLLTNLKDLGYAVTLVPDDLEPRQPYTRRLQALGIEVVHSPGTAAQHIAALSARLRLCVLSRPYVAARYVHLVREHAPDAVLAFDTVDLHFLREGRRAEMGQGSHSVAAGFRELELGLTRACDVTLVVSEEERELLTDLVGGADVEVVPNANEIAGDVPGRDARSGLLFVGSFDHTPNADAATHLVHDVMPLVWAEIPDVEVTIVGVNPPDEVLALASPRVRVAGWVEDIGPLLRLSVAMVAPLRYGAGMKGKVTQSMAAGLPVITSPVGAEGLPGVDGEDLLVGDSAGALAGHVRSLCADSETWARLSQAGQRLVERACSPAIQREALRRLLARVDDAERAVADLSGRQMPWAPH